MLHVRPIRLRDARKWIAEHHRHSVPPRGWLFGCAVCEGDTVRGVGVASRPIARGLDDGRCVEIVRVCTDGVRNGCSMLYGALCRAAAALGYARAVTYTLESESGISPAAAGFCRVEVLPERAWVYAAQGRYIADIFGVPTSPIGNRIRWERRLAGPIPEPEGSDV